MNQNPKNPEQKTAATGKKMKQKTQTKQSKKVIPKPQLPVCQILINFSNILKGKIIPTHQGICCAIGKCAFL
jgi:hypothetical protein